VADRRRTTEKARAIEAVVDAAKPAFVGRPPPIQGAALADLTAIWVTGHVALGDPTATREMWQTVLAHHIEYTQKLIDLYAKRMGIDGRH